MLGSLNGRKRFASSKVVRATVRVVSYRRLMQHQFQRRDVVQRRGGVCPLMTIAGSGGNDLVVVWCKDHDSKHTKIADTAVNRVDVD